MRHNLNLPIANLRDLHNVAEVTDTAIDLDLVLEELLEGGDVEDFVAGGLRGVDDELLCLSSSSSSTRLRNSSTGFTGEEGELIPSS